MVGFLIRAMNDPPRPTTVGIVTGPGGKTMAIAVFLSDSTADTATREATAAKIARMAWGR
jgi:hypothetical protein